MRSHGITNFPDPDSHGDIGINGGPGTGLDPNSPQFKAADRACKPLMPAPNASEAGKNRPALLRYARCMRAHGIADFPDPQSGGGGLQVSASAGSDLNANSPLYKAADKACKHYLPGGGRGGSTQTGGGGGGS
jgi:hypothetical protein